MPRVSCSRVSWPAKAGHDTGEVRAQPRLTYLFPRAPLHSAIRRWAAAAASSGRDPTGASTAAGVNNGRPICCKASGPCARYFRHHLYKSSRPTPNSAANAVTSPAADLLGGLGARRTDIQAGHDRCLVHVQAGTAFNDGFHQLLHDTGTKADRYAARFTQSLPCVLPVAGGDKGQYPSGGAGQTPCRGQQHHRGTLRPPTIAPAFWRRLAHATTPPDTAPAFSAMGVRPRPLANSVLNACNRARRTDLAGVAAGRSPSFPSKCDCPAILGIAHSLRRAQRCPPFARNIRSEISAAGDACSQSRRNSVSVNARDDGFAP